MTSQVYDATLAAGRLSFGEYMQLALYGPDGYYTKRVSIGHSHGDFYTASQSPLFARTLARYTMRAWRAFGRPEQLQVVEFGAGQGELALLVCQALLAEIPPLVQIHYTIVEVSPRLQHIQQQCLAVLNDHRLHLCFSKPDSRLPTVVLANEVLDAIPVERLKRVHGTWQQAYVEAADGALTTHWLPAITELSQLAETWLPIPDGTTAELPLHYDTLFRQVATCGAPLKALFLDYGIGKEEWQAGVRPNGTVRGYLAHEVVNPLHHPGCCDITADVHWDFAQYLARQAGLTVHDAVPQGRFLMNEGIFSVLEEESQRWLSDARQAARLTGQFKHLVLPGGMGERFAVMECCKE